MGHARKVEDLLETAGRTAAGSAQALRGALEFTGRVAAAPEPPNPPAEEA